MADWLQCQVVATCQSCLMAWLPGRISVIGPSHFLWYGPRRYQILVWIAGITVHPAIETTFNLPVNYIFIHLSTFLDLCCNSLRELLCHHLSLHPLWQLAHFLVPILISTVDLLAELAAVDSGVSKNTMVWSALLFLIDILVAFSVLEHISGNLPIFPCMFPIIFVLLLFDCLCWGHVWP
jgi:hypothetical protein